MTADIVRHTNVVKVNTVGNGSFVYKDMLIYSAPQIAITRYRAESQAST